jgi:hypothetical protein
VAVAILAPMQRADALRLFSHTVRFLIAQDGS